MFYLLATTPKKNLKKKLTNSKDLFGITVAPHRHVVAVASLFLNFKICKKEIEILPNAACLPSPSAFL